MTHSSSSQPIACQDNICPYIGMTLRQWQGLGNVSIGERVRLVPEVPAVTQVYVGVTFNALKIDISLPTPACNARCQTIAQR